MSVEHFLATVLPSQGHRFVLNTSGEQGSANFRPSQRAFAPGAEAEITKLAKWHAERDCNSYFATGGFMAPLPDKQGRPYAGRTADRVIAMRCLRLDLDCGEGKPYAGKREALRALVEFCNQYGLSMPWLVDSGYGLHAYWPFDRDVTPVEWMQLAQRLAAACTAAGLDVDATTTLDLARVLRLPGTYNFKRGEAKPVRIVNEGTTSSPEALVARMPQVGDAPMLGAVPSALRGQTSELQQNLHTPYTLRGVLTGCPGVAAMLRDGGARAQEPLWKATLDLVHKAADPLQARERVARALSQGHPGFTEEGFQSKWEQTQQQDYHPPTCRQMAAAGLPECASCPFNGKISSPLTLGYAQPALRDDGAAVPPPPAPTPAPAPAAPSGAPLGPSVMKQLGTFQMMTDGTVQVVDGTLTRNLQINQGRPCRTIDKETPDGTKLQEAIPLLHYRLVEAERLLDPTSQRSLTAITFDRGLDSHVRIELSNAELTDARAFHSLLAGNGIYGPRKDITYLVEHFMPEFLAQLQRARAASRIANRCGWTDDLTGFVLGTQLLTATGEEHVRPGSIPEEMLAFHAQGDEAQWRRAFDIVLAGGPDRQAVVALAIASPLMAFTGVDGVMLNAFSPESGVGKSTLGDAALSVWGAPNKLRKSARDTANATWRIAGVLGNLPMVIDEFTNVEGRNLSDFVYTLSQGREKHRLTTDARLQAGGVQRWCLACITTANNSVHDKLQAFRSDAVAEAARVFDMRLRPLNVPAEELGRRKTELQAFSDHYGFLGPKLARLYLSKPTDYWRRQVMDRVAKWDMKVAESASDRFRSVCAALIEVGAVLGKALGLAMDVPAILEVVESEWRRQLQDFEAERRKPIDFVKAYLNEYMGDFATTGGVAGDALMSSTPRRFRGEIRGRSVNGKWQAESVMIPMDPLRNFVRDNNGNYKAFLEWLGESYDAGLVLRQGKLVYLEGQMQQFTTNAVEFSANILTEQALLRVAPSPATSIPPGPARARS